MNKLLFAVAVGLSVGLGACATTNDSASQIGTGAANSATQATSDQVNQKVSNTTTGFWQRLFGNH